jgi:hypothetical protein
VNPTGDLEQIAAVVAGYCQAYDDRDAAELGATLAEGAVVTMEGGRFDGQVYKGRDAIVAWLASTWAVTPPCLHLTGNLRLVPEEDHVSGRTDYLFSVHDGERWTLAGAGRYVDRFERADGRWEIAARRVVQQRKGPGTS